MSTYGNSITVLVLNSSTIEFGSRAVFIHVFVFFPLVIDQYPLSPPAAFDGDGQNPGSVEALGRDLPPDGPGLKLGELSVPVIV